MITIIALIVYVIGFVTTSYVTGRRLTEVTDPDDFSGYVLVGISSVGIALFWPAVIAFYFIGKGVSR